MYKKILVLFILYLISIISFNFLTAIIIVVGTAVIIIPFVSQSATIAQGTKELIISTSIFVCVFVTFSFLHGVRTIHLLQGYDIDSGLILVKKPKRHLSIRTSDHDQTSKVSIPGSPYGGAALNPYEAVKTKNLLNRRQTCSDQIAHWTGVLRHTEALMLIQAEAGPKTLANDDRNSSAV